MTRPEHPPASGKTSAAKQEESEDFRFKRKAFRKWKQRRKAKPHIPYNHALTERARENRKDPTPAEHRLWREVLNKGRFRGFKFTRQKPLDEYIVDFYCAELQLAVEVDGDSHAIQTDYDQRRMENLGALGVKIVRYTNDDVMHGLDGVFDDFVRVVVEREVFCRGDG